MMDNNFYSTGLFAITLATVLSAAGADSLDPNSSLAVSQRNSFERFRDCEECPEMLVLPMGSFMMGAIEGESRNPHDVYGPDASGHVRSADEVNIIPSEHPRHAVKIDIRFAISVNEVTFGEWGHCVYEGGCQHKPDPVFLGLDGLKNLGDDHPVVDVSYFDILEYITWLNTRGKVKGYRLPTEAEWEYAARAGTTTRYAQGDDLDPSQANFSGSTTERTFRQVMPQLIDRNNLVRVSELNSENGWGLRHMSGNVSEITISCWSDVHLGLMTSSQYLLRALSEEPCRRVAKGGDVNSGVDSLRLARRTRPLENSRRDWRGFRILKELRGAE